MIEVLGVVATLTILLSLTRTDQIELRLINSIGSLLMVIYGWIISAESVCLLNACCMIINIYKINEQLSNEDSLPTQQDKHHR